MSRKTQVRADVAHGAEARKPRPVEKTQRLLYHVGDCAFQLSVSAREIWRLVDEGRLRPTRIGKRVLVSHAAILEFVAANTQRAAEQTRAYHGSNTHEPARPAVAPAESEAVS